MILIVKVLVLVADKVKVENAAMRIINVAVMSNT